jgi:hypothetical protein
MSASMSISSNRMRTGLSPCFRCLRYRRIRIAPGEGEREGGRLLIVLLDAALHLVYEACGRLARLGSSRSWSPQGADRAALPVVRTNGFDRKTPRGVVSAPITGGIRRSCLSLIMAPRASQAPLRTSQTYGESFQTSRFTADGRRRFATSREILCRSMLPRA